MAGMGQPRSGFVAELGLEGVGAIVSLTEQRLDEKELGSAGLRYLHLPVRDMQAPTALVIGAYIEFSVAQIAECRPVVVHCSAGLGRTGTVLACYLVRERGYSASGAIEQVRALRPGSIETLEQESAVFECAETARSI